MAIIPKKIRFFLNGELIGEVEIEYLTSTQLKKKEFEYIKKGLDELEKLANNED